MKLRSAVPLAAVLALACQRTTDPEPANTAPPHPTAEVAPVEVTTSEPPAPSTAASTDAGMHPDASDAGPGDSPDPPADAAPPATACAPAAHPPTLDVYLRFSTRRQSLGPSAPRLEMLVAKITAATTKLNYEVWASPEPTSCEAKADGADMLVHCITDEAQIRARVHVVGEELVVDSLGLGALMLEPVGSRRKPATEQSMQRQASVKVPCGTRLRVHPASRGPF